MDSHTRHVIAMASRLRQRGARVVDVEGRMPVWIAVLDDLIFSVRHKQGKKTHRELRSEHLHFDGVLTWTEDFDAWKARRESQGFRFIRAARKRPDLLAYEGGLWKAVEVVTGARGASVVRGHETNYSMWDDVIVHITE